MLVSLLPGLRNLRASLAAGYLWIFGIWLAVAPGVPADTSQLEGVPADVVDMARYAGRPVTLAAITFAAYVAGVLSVAFMGRLIRIGNRIHRTKYSWVSPGHHRAIRVERILVDAVLGKLSDRFLNDLSFRKDVARHLNAASRRLGESAGEREVSLGLSDKLPDGTRVDGNSASHVMRAALSFMYYRRELLYCLVLVEYYVWEARLDVRDLRGNLLGREPELAEAYDQHRSEGDFRLGLVLPLAFTFLVLALRWNGIWVLAGIIPVVLFYLGVGVEARGDEDLAAFLATGRIGGNNIDRLESGSICFRSYEQIADLPDSTSGKALFYWR